MKITFWGGTETVTGSQTLLERGDFKALVDCGLYQGLKDIVKLNSLKPPYRPSELRSVFLTHAHLDHCGMLPQLVARGFKGTIYCTKPTFELARTILLDAASISDEYYNRSDVDATLKHFKFIEFNHHFMVDDVNVCFLPAGHILGAASIEFRFAGKKVVFSGDIGRKKDPLIPEPLPCPEADLVVMESTYGGKVRQGKMYAELFSFLVDISRQKKIGLIASFAIARGQLLLTMIQEFFTKYPDESFPVYIDSPMMEEACKIYQHYSEMTKLPQQLNDVMKNFEHIQYDRQWSSLKKKEGPFLVISSSGMMTGGRILRHLETWQNRKDAVLFLPGYQAEGTPGRSFLEGQKSIMTTDKLIDWQGEVLGSEAFSSHADQDELIEWVGSNGRIFLIHGEESSKQKLQTKLWKDGKDIRIPLKGESIEI